LANLTAPEAFGLWPFKGERDREKKRERERERILKSSVVRY